MNKTQLKDAVGLSSSTVAKLSKNEYVSLETVDNICQYFECKIEDVIEIQHTSKVKINDYTQS